MMIGAGEADRSLALIAAAAAHLAAGQADEATKLARQAIAVCPDRVRASEILGLVSFAQKDWTQAATIFGRAFRIRGNDRPLRDGMIAAVCARGAESLAAGRFTEAMVDLLTAKKAGACNLSLSEIRPGDTPLNRAMAELRGTLAAIDHSAWLESLVKEQARAWCRTAIATDDAETAVAMWRQLARWIDPGVDAEDGLGVELSAFLCGRVERHLAAGAIAAAMEALWILPATAVFPDEVVARWVPLLSQAAREYAARNEFVDAARCCDRVGLLCPKAMADLAAVVSFSRPAVIRQALAAEETGSFDKAVEYAGIACRLSNGFSEPALDGLAERLCTRLLEQAGRQYGLGFNGTAVRLIETMVALAPSVRLLTEAADFAERMGRPESAMLCWSALLERREAGWAQALLHFVRLLLSRKGETVADAAVLQAMTTEVPESWKQEAWILYIGLLVQTKRYETAHAAVGRFIRYYGEKGEGFRLLAGLRREVFDLPGAFHALARAVALEPASVEGLFQMADVARVMKRLDDSCRLYGYTLTLDPGHRMARLYVSGLTGW